MQYRGSSTMDLFQVVVLMACFSKLCFEVSAGKKEPLHIWPLTTATCGFDVETRNDAIAPKISACVGAGSVHPWFSANALAVNGEAANALALNGETSRYIDLPVSAPSKKAGDVFITINVKPTASAGTIFDLEGDSCSQCLHRMTVTLMSTRHISIVLDAGDPSTQATVITNEQLQNSSWNYLMIGVKGKELSVIHDSSKEQKYSLPNKGLKKHKPDPWKHKLGPGKLRIGATLEGSDILKGEVTCAILTVKKPKDKERDVNNDCLPPFDIKLPNSPTFKPVEVAVFPLYALSAGVKFNHSLPSMELSLAVDPRPVNDLAVLGQGFLRMDGSPLSVVDFLLDFGLFQSDFSIGVFVYLDGRAMGTLLHAQNVAGGQEVFVVFSETDVSVTVAEASLGQCGHVFVPRPASAGSWCSLALGLRGSHLFLFLGDVASSGGFYNCTSPSGSSQWSLRLGGSGGEGEGFHGNMACLALYDFAFSSPAASAAYVIKSCAVSQSVPTESHRPRSQMDEYRYRNVIKNHLPLPSLPPWKKFQVPSISACAKECRLVNRCRSFGVTQRDVTTGKRQCRLFDFLTRHRLVEIGGSAYYAMVAVG